MYVSTPKKRLGPNSSRHQSYALKLHHTTPNLKPSNFLKRSRFLHRIRTDFHAARSCSSLQHDTISNTDGEFKSLENHCTELWEAQHSLNANSPSEHPQRTPTIDIGGPRVLIPDYGRTCSVQKKLRRGWTRGGEGGSQGVHALFSVLMSHTPISQFRQENLFHFYNFNPS